MVLPDVDKDALPPPAQKVLAPDAPAPLRAMAARGVLPGLKPPEIVTVVAWLAADADQALAEAARATLAKLPTPILAGALGADLPGSVAEGLAHAQPKNADVVLGLLRMPRVTPSALEHLARFADERTGEIIATNEELLLRHPTVIERLYMNKAVRMSTADRLVELAVRNKVELGIPAFKEAAAAIHNELIPEPSPEPTFDDALFQSTDELAAKIGDDGEDTHEVDDEGQEQVRPKYGSLQERLNDCSVSTKIRTAMLGTAAERLILVRDPNRLVQAAVAKSPALSESEVARITASRAMSDEVLRIIAMNRDHVRSYQVKLNLVSNPRTPFTFASRLVPHLRESDLRSISKSKNVSGAVAQAVQQQLTRKSSKR